MAIVYQCAKCSKALSDSTHLVEDLEEDETVVKNVSENVMISVTNAVMDTTIGQYWRKEIKIYCKCGDHLGELIARKTPRSKTVDRSYKLLQERIVGYTVGSSLVQGEAQATTEIAKMNMAQEKMEDLIMRHGERLELIDQLLTTRTLNLENERPQKRKK